MWRAHAYSQCGKITCQQIRLFTLGSSSWQESDFMGQWIISYGKRSELLQSHMPMYTTTKYTVSYLNTRLTKITSQKGRGQDMECKVYFHHTRRWWCDGGAGDSCWRRVRRVPGDCVTERYKLLAPRSDNIGKCASNQVEEGFIPGAHGVWPHDRRGHDGLGDAFR